MLIEEDQRYRATANAAKAGFCNVAQVRTMFDKNPIMNFIISSSHPRQDEVDVVAS